MQTLKKILFLLSSSEKKNAGLLLLMILIMAILDTIGVASILPFMAVLTNPSLIETNTILNSMFQISKKFGVENIQHFLFSLGIIVFFVLVASLIFKAITTYAQIKYSQMREFSIGKRLVEGYLHQPYSWFLNQHSTELGKTILSEVAQVVNTGIRPLIELIAKGIVAIALVSLLLIADPILAITICFSLGGIYLIIFYFIKSFTNRLGKDRLKNNQLRFKILSEAFGASKEVKVSGLEDVYIKGFSKSAQVFAQTQASAVAVAQLPRFILEAIAFGGILLIIIYIMSQTGSFNNSIPIISLYVFAGYRLIPSLQQIYASFTSLTYAGPAIDKLTNEIKNLKHTNIKYRQKVLPLSKSIQLKNICYNYPASSRTVLKDINLCIPAKSTVGVVGITGSGKTTLIDIILGLLEAQKGTIEVDGQIITKHNVRSWQDSIGYVPQHIYLSDNTIAENIAFGVELKNIDYESVKKAAEIANLNRFVSEELPEKYQTIIGERGIRLSGGQRQRIGIARAMYHNPQLLIFDEATSSLDNLTEQIVMDAINNLGQHRTIIIIAHRLNTLKNCDIVFKIENGKIIEQEKFSKIL